MNRFINSEISEKELFDLTPLDTAYEAVYQCSALVLEEYRRFTFDCFLLHPSLT